MKSTDYKDLVLWKKAIELVKSIYSVTASFPKGELFGLTNQIRRAAVSIPSNIAEGQARRYNTEFIQFLYQSFGSLAELETQIIISKELNFIEVEYYNQILLNISEIRKMIHGLLNHLKQEKIAC